MEQLSLFPDIVTPNTIPLKGILSTEVVEPDFSELGNKIMNSAISGKPMKNLPDTSMTNNALNNRANTFLLGLQLNKMETINKLLGRVEAVEAKMTDPETLEDLHPQWLVEIYNSLTNNLDKQIKALTQVKETLAGSINIFNTQINNPSASDSPFGRDKILDSSAREKIHNVIKGLVNLNEFIASDPTKEIQQDGTQL